MSCFIIYEQEYTRVTECYAGRIFILGTITAGGDFVLFKKLFIYFSSAKFMMFNWKGGIRNTISIGYQKNGQSQNWQFWNK